MKPDEIARLDDLIQLITAADLSEAEIRLGEAAVRVRRERTGRVRLHGDETRVAAPAEREKEPEPPAVRAHMVGYFTPADPPLKVGDRIEAGTVVGSINSLGLDNEVRSKVAGVVKEVLAGDGLAVEYGRALYHLESDEEES